MSVIPIARKENPTIANSPRKLKEALESAKKSSTELDPLGLL